MVGFSPLAVTPTVAVPPIQIMVSLLIVTTMGILSGTVIIVSA